MLVQCHDQIAFQAPDSGANLPFEREGNHISTAILCILIVVQLDNQDDIFVNKHHAEARNRQVDRYPHMPSTPEGNSDVVLSQHNLSTDEPVPAISD